VGDWDSLFAEVTREVRPLEREVRDKNGRWHSLRIRPYRTSDNKIDGVKSW
jgi:two-component system CheB/CheR fusion protein